MTFGKKELNRYLGNFIGLLKGYDKCVFCGDRSNWKEWIDVITVTGANNKKIEFELPMCADCFVDKTLKDLLSSVNKTIAESNKFCQGFGAPPYYSDADQIRIRSAIEELKKQFRG